MAKTIKTDATATKQTPKQLEDQLATKQADLLGYKKGLAAGELKNTGVIKATRREIAEAVASACVSGQFTHHNIICAASI